MQGHRYKSDRGSTLSLFYYNHKKGFLFKIRFKHKLWNNLVYILSLYQTSAHGFGDVYHI